MTADPIRARSIFISDAHLGYRGANAEALLEFLETVETEQLFLVGDIVDPESLNRRYFWPRTHGEVVAAILRKARQGTRVILVPGNHHAALRLIAWPAHRHGNDIAGSHSRHIDGAVWRPGQVTEESP